MESTTPTPKRKKGLLIVSIILAIILGITSFLYYNFNQLLSNALVASFESNIVSDVYELNFEKLRVDLFRGNISVYSVSVRPHDKPLQEYPYINSSFQLTTERLLLQNVEIFTLLKSKKLIVENISITKPDFEVKLAGEVHLFVPFKDSASVSKAIKSNQKNSFSQIILNEFKLIDASFHTINLDKQQEFKIKRFNISLDHLNINQGMDNNKISLRRIDFSVGEFKGRLKKGPIQSISFNDYNVIIDSLHYQKTKDTLVYTFKDVNTSLNILDVQTADSLFHLTLQSINLSYKERSIKLRNLAFKPNRTNAELDKKYKFQHAQLAGSLGTLNMLKIDFDSLIYHRKIIVDTISIKNVAVSIFQDNTKPIDKNKLPPYLGQVINKIPIPIDINHVKIEHVDFVNVERIPPDSIYATANINKATVMINNINNRKTIEKLELIAEGLLENKVHFKATLRFDYQKPEFNFEGNLGKFNLPDLNPLIVSYTPAKINRGVCDGLSFSGLIEHTKSSGSMKFLYHDLDIDLKLKHKAKWKSSVISFAANTYLASSNPGSSDLPPHIVEFQVQRNMNKAFVNLLIKSILQGLKETMIPSKENKKAYKEAKKKSKQ